MEEDKVIKYKSEPKPFVYNKASELEKGSQNGLNWVASYSTSLTMLTKLVDTGCHILVTYTRNEKIPLLKFDVELTNSGDKITRRIGLTTDIGRSSGYSDGHFTYEFTLKPYRLSTRNFPIDQLFVSSFASDVVLVVDGYKMHVNKSFLSIHSDFFRSLFSNNFKEGSMTEISIEEVKYEEFSRLLAVISPNSVLPTDESVEGLLKLAEYFLMPAVINVVEQHLLGASHFSFFQSLFTADKYKMDKLLDKCISLVTTLDHVKRVKAFPEYDNLNHITKSKILDRLMQVV
ncbi:hypothetical protein GCK72_019953 [Caenorhabditis remanei]|uniref:BTB domain-containing protein n=1 Tax=Caenorhabditis remanei TaxID=31234 RepID=A0A6A5GFB8_CAERE|nr:hypothetical protein GCK72_019953 [Caenorhabditis remanei]KAF1753396.1 hypothetical protein GCK72_019953 [Caenorhabditis remanei]